MKSALALIAATSTPMRLLFLILGPALAGLAGCAAIGAAHRSTQPVRSESEASGWPGVTDHPAVGAVAAGRRIAVEHCAECHSIDRTSASPNIAAPPLRDVLAINDEDSLAYRLIDGMAVGHGDMPIFDFDIRAADDLIAYIESITATAH